ncbi:MAG: DNA methylase N-4, partial [Oxalobacteraceae bacterium]
MSPILKITYLPAGSLRGYENNARQHSKAQLKKLKRSIRQNGWTNPIIVDEDHMVLAGHGRLAAAIEMGIDRIPTVQLTHMTPAQKRAYIIADNAIAEKASWSKDMLRLELNDLSTLGFELEQTGFDTIEIDRLL